MSSRETKTASGAPKLVLARLSAIFIQAEKLGDADLCRRVFKGLMSAVNRQIRAQIIAATGEPDFDLETAVLDEFVDGVLRAAASKELENWLRKFERELQSIIQATLSTGLCKSETSIVPLAEAIDPLFEERILKVIEIKRIVDEPNEPLWREALQLCIRGYSHKEAAEQLGLPKEKVSRWMRAVYDLLREYARLEGRGQ